MAFGGIAGVVSSEQGDPDDIISGPLPTINTKSSEVSDMQDLYRRTLAASWKSKSSELPADKLIEDLFYGGPSWKNGTHGSRMSRLDESLHVAGSENLDAYSQQPSAGNRLSPGFQHRPRSPSSKHYQNEGKSPEVLSAMAHGRRGGSIEQQIYDNTKTKMFKSRAPEPELSEFDVREDLRSWEITPRD